MDFTEAALYGLSLSFKQALARATDEHESYCDDPDCIDDGHAAAFSRIGEDIADMYHD